MQTVIEIALVVGALYLLISAFFIEDDNRTEDSTR